MGPGQMDLVLREKLGGAGSCHLSASDAARVPGGAGSPCPCTQHHSSPCKGHMSWYKSVLWGGSLAREAAGYQVQGLALSAGVDPLRGDGMTSAWKTQGWSPDGWKRAQLPAVTSCFLELSLWRSPF